MARLKLGVGEQEFLKTKFRAYYYRSITDLWVPKRLESREIGFLRFDGSMVRHLSFESEGEFKASILKDTPWGVFYSISSYEDPSNPNMDMKGLVASDLVFDVDVKDLSPPCKLSHDFTMYLTPDGFLSLSSQPGGAKVEVAWVCRYCIEEGRNEVQKLVKVLVEDLGVDESRIEVYFSGHRGFHVHVDDEELARLDKRTRQEIVDYLRLTNFNYERFLRLAPIDGLQASYLLGWPKRILEGLEPRVRSQYRVSLTPYPKQTIDVLLSKGLRGLVESVVKEIRVRIDPQVTQDLSRIFRLPMSINEKTGLVKTRCRDVGSCRPLEDSVVIDEEPVKVFIEYAPKIELGGYEYGPFEKQEVKLPSYLAAFLVSKGVARLSS